MTLFDRKVDLARFTPSTPLYVMCRDWMCNNPNPEKMEDNYRNTVTMASSVPDGGNGMGSSQVSVTDPGFSLAPRVTCL